MLLSKTVTPSVYCQGVASIAVRQAYKQSLAQPQRKLTLFRNSVVTPIFANDCYH
jgi:hypothetical protein